MSDLIDRSVSEHCAVISKIRTTMSHSIRTIGTLMSRSLADGGTIFWCGNGGSAADSQHLAAELVGRLKKNRRALRSLALTTDSSVLTCIANDFGFDHIFARQLEALARPNDVLIVISTSGNSENVLRVIKMANTMDVKCVGLLGQNGGLAKDLLQDAVVVPSKTTARIQEAHILIGHILCEQIEQDLGLA